jgi:hypothetical protein
MVIESIGFFLAGVLLGMLLTYVGVWLGYRASKGIQGAFTIPSEEPKLPTDEELWEEEQAKRIFGTPD